MMFFIGLLTFLLVINCLLLILLVLVQLPKKDAGAGMAFGGGTADALFGAGSGNALTKITKYAAGIFLGLSLVLGWMQSRAHNEGSASQFTKLLEQQQQQTPLAPPATTPQPAKPQAAPPAANGLLAIPLEATNAAPPPTNKAK